MAKKKTAKQPAKAARQEKPDFVRKYWWVVLIAVVLLAIVAVAAVGLFILGYFTPVQAPPQPIPLPASP